MADIARTCIVTRYDETIKEPPFLTIPIDEFVVMEPEDTHDDLGVRFARSLRDACNRKGYFFQCYTNGRKHGDYDYEVVVYPE